MQKELNRLWMMTLEMLNNSAKKSSDHDNNSNNSSSVSSSSNFNYNNSNNDHLIDIIKELACTNHKLKSELLDSHDMLMDLRNDLNGFNCQKQGQQSPENEEESSVLGELQQCYDESSANHRLYPTLNFSSSAPTQSENTMKAHHQRFKNKSPSVMDTNNGMIKKVGLTEEEAYVHPKRNSISKYYVHQEQRPFVSSWPSSIPSSSIPAPSSATPALPLASAVISVSERGTDTAVTPDCCLASNNSSMTQYHYHYHYYSDKNEKLKNSNNDDIHDATELDRTFAICQRIHNQVRGILHKIKRTEIKALRRRQQQQQEHGNIPDIMELTLLSNSKLNYLLLSEIQHLGHANSHLTGDSAFFPLLGLFEEMLSDLCQLRINLNDIQMDYVRKVRESDIQFKKRVWKRVNSGNKQSQQQEKEEEEFDIGKAFSNWLTNLLLVQSTPTTDAMLQRHKDSIATRSSDYCRLHARIMTANDISTHHRLYSNSKLFDQRYHHHHHHHHHHHYNTDSYRKITTKRSMPLLRNKETSPFHASHHHSTSNANNSRFPIPELHLDHDNSRIVVKRFKPSTSISTPISTTTDSVHGITTTTSLIMKRRVLHNQLQYLMV
ncbi:hypothetical protein BDF20DRAFT_659329 [Mycotypha africana]|uniref:uncharacterized protein n=1 Tax=Mycotypha africana TaxID=64632 RepID=UPI002301C8A4|nr:uncharacterized protein BDF20DRAFT_659329 [Mycotypha africana]KAI8973556.1 hypothetical protein BDF20DRAFT_659329 [Mycotypha africana]